MVDYRAEEDIEGTIEFFEMLAEKYGKSKIFSVQMRLEAAKNNRLIDALRRAGVRMVCIGYKSPVASPANNNFSRRCSFEGLEKVESRLVAQCYTVDWFLPC